VSKNPIDDLIDHCSEFEGWYKRTDEEVCESVLLKLKEIPGEFRAEAQYYIFYKEDVPRLVQALLRRK